MQTECGMGQGLTYYLPNISHGSRHLQRSAPWLIKIHEQEDEATGSKWQVSGCWHQKLTVIDTQKMALLKGQRHSSGGSLEFLKLRGMLCHLDALGIQSAGFLS